MGIGGARGTRSHLRKGVHVQKHPQLPSPLGADQLPVDPDLENFFLSCRADLGNNSIAASSGPIHTRTTSHQTQRGYTL